VPQRHSQPGQKLADAEGLRQVIVRAGIERLDLLMFLAAGREITIGIRDHSRTCRITSMPSMSGSPGPGSSNRLPGGGLQHAVAAAIGL